MLSRVLWLIILLQEPFGLLELHFGHGLALSNQLDALLSIGHLLVDVDDVECVAAHLYEVVALSRVTKELGQLALE